MLKFFLKRWPTTYFFYLYTMPTHKQLFKEIKNGKDEVVTKMLLSLVLLLNHGLKALLAAMEQCIIQISCKENFK